MNWTQLGGDIDGEATFNYSGKSVSLSSDGTTVAIGAIYNGDGGLNAGQVRVYQYSGTSWVKLGGDIDGEAAGDNSGYSVSLNANGTIVAIGAIYNDGNGNNSGQVRVYKYDGSNWLKVGLDIDGESVGDNSGYSVSLSANGTTVAIGAVNNSARGQVRVYNFLNGSWTQIGGEDGDIDGEAVNDFSGSSVSLSANGTRVAIGAVFNDDGGSNAGQVRVYQYSGTSWVKLGGDIDGEVTNDNSGYSVSLSEDGTTVAIGAPSNDGSGTNAGQVRVYQYSGNSWVKLGRDIDGETVNDQSGWSVSLSANGTTVAIGAPFNDGSGTNAGQVRVYQYSGNDWLKVGLDIDGEAPGDNSGQSVSLSADGTTVAIGSINNSGSADLAGQVRVYKLQTSSNNSLQSQQPKYSPPFEILNNELVFGDFENGGFTGTVKNPEPPIIFNAMRFFYTAAQFKGMGIDASKLRAKGLTAKTLKGVGFLDQELVLAGFKNDEK